MKKPITLACIALAAAARLLPFAARASRLKSPRRVRFFSKQRTVNLQKRDSLQTLSSPKTSNPNKTRKKAMSAEFLQLGILK